VLTPSRVNGFANMLEAVRRRTRMLTADLPTFPSLLIDHEGYTAQASSTCISLQHSHCFLTFLPVLERCTLSQRRVWLLPCAGPSHTPGAFC
jgi:hypothetical protein